ncbi:hypothetical protein BOX15_Mlig028556g3 [Macrostomum lignano]|uniref:polynucleotide adenylyltransferase n=1 Tax=Macrostomum lignano TaxID=282301 RepID=A0A267DKM2_9PLAT|nr:hypothetical protein BOX15_Mlig028556g3 [Macrostomum lignano]
MEGLAEVNGHNEATELMEQEAAMAAVADAAETEDLGELEEAVEAVESMSSNSRYSVLCFEQVQLLHEFMQREICIQGRGPYPTLRLTLRDLVSRVRARIEADGVAVRDVRLNGSSASFIIGMNSAQSYNDLDLLFGVDLSAPDTVDRIKLSVLDCLHSFLPSGSEEILKRRHCSGPAWGRSDSNMMEGYVRKLVRIQSTDSWSLISLGYANSSQPEGLTVELKFVDKMRRKFEFTVDSFQIILDSLCTFYSVKSEEPPAISEHFYPTVIAESVSGSFVEAYGHLMKKEISTRNPEEIRGGGLLKYCKLLVDGFLPAQGVDVVNLEKYMCSRFFIDFPDLKKQRAKMESYLAAHFPSDRDLEQRVHYLQILHQVVKSSTVCLMQQERRSTLYLISDMIGEIYIDIEARNHVIALEPFNSTDWVLDQVFYGTQYFPTHLTPVGSPHAAAAAAAAAAAEVGAADYYGTPVYSDGTGRFYSCILSTSQGHCSALPAGHFLSTGGDPRLQQQQQQQAMMPQSSYFAMPALSLSESVSSGCSSGGGSESQQSSNASSAVEFLMEFPQPQKQVQIQTQQQQLPAITVTSDSGSSD